MYKFSLVVAIAFVGLTAAATATPRHGCCPHCGCATTKKVCRLKPDVKKEKEVQYSCITEDFCVPGPSDPCGCKWVCDENGHRHKETVWKPNCAEVRTKAKLVKKEVVHEKSTFKWVVEEVCCECHACVTQVESTPADEQSTAESRVERSPRVETVSHETFSRRSLLNPSTWLK